MSSNESVGACGSWGRVRRGLTCDDGGAGGQAGAEGERVDALQEALAPGLQVRAQHAVDPHVSVQRRAEVPLCACADNPPLHPPYMHARPQT